MKEMKSFKKKLFFSLMIFTFSWVIIGDLVSMHLRVIYNIDIHNSQTFTKKDNSVKIKKGKSDFGNTILLSFLTETNKPSLANNSFFFIISFIEKLNIFSSEIIKLSIGRAPPTI